MIETKFREYLLTIPGITALVVDRIYLEEAEQGATRPYIVISVDESTHYHHMTGQCGLAEVDLEVVIAGTTYVNARDVLEAMRIPLSGKIRNVDMGASNAVNVRTMSLQGFKAATVNPIDGGDQGKRGIISMWNIVYREPTS